VTAPDFYSRIVLARAVILDEISAEEIENVFASLIDKQAAVLRAHQ
jgi:hypothetical protein